MAIDWLTKKSKGKDQIIRSVGYGSIALAFVITVFHLLPNDHYLKLNSSFDVDISLVHQKAAGEKSNNFRSHLMAAVECLLKLCLWLQFAWMGVRPRIICIGVLDLDRTVGWFLSRLI